MDREVSVTDYFRRGGRDSCPRRTSVAVIAASLLAAAMMAASPALARSFSVHLLLSSDAPYYADVERAVRDVMLREQPGVPVTTRLLDQAPQSSPGQDAYIVTVGTPATEYALKHYSDTPLLGLFVPKATWDQLLINRQRTAPVGVVVIDQPIARSLALGRLLKPSAKTIGTVLGRSSREQIEALQNETARQGMTLRYAELDAGGDPLTTLTPIVESADIFLAIPDHAIFNRAVAKWVLYLGFRQQIPIIGFSRSYTEAGAVASVYSTPENIGRQGGEILVELATGDDSTAWRTHFPRYYTLRTNKVVARALGIALPDEATLYRMYADALAPQP